MDMSNTGFKRTCDFLINTIKSNSQMQIPEVTIRKSLIFNYGAIIMDLSNLKSFEELQEYIISCSDILTNGKPDDILESLKNYYDNFNNLDNMKIKTLDTSAVPNEESDKKEEEFLEKSDENNELSGTIKSAINDQLKSRFAQSAIANNIISKINGVQDKVNEINKAKTTKTVKPRVSSKSVSSKSVKSKTNNKEKSNGKSKGNG